MSRSSHSLSCLYLQQLCPEASSASLHSGWCRLIQISSSNPPGTLAAPLRSVTPSVARLVDLRVMAGGTITGPRYSVQGVVCTGVPLPTQPPQPERLGIDKSLGAAWEVQLNVRSLVGHCEGLNPIPERTGSGPTLGKVGVFVLVVWSAACS